MNLEKIMLSESSHKIPHIGIFHFYKMPKSIKTESR